MNKRYLLFVMLLVLGAMLLSTMVSAQGTSIEASAEVSASVATDDTLRVGQAVAWEGTVGIITKHGEDRTFEEAAIFIRDNGDVFELDMAMGQAYALQGLRVSVDAVATELNSSFSQFGRGLGLDVMNARALEARAPMEDQTFLNILCLISGDTEPTPANDTGYTQFWDQPDFGMVKYWQDMSYNQFDLTGSDTTDRWVTTSQTNADYEAIVVDGGNDFGALIAMYTVFLDDCITELENDGGADFDFSTWDGFNLIVNTNPVVGSASIGIDSGVTVTADGVNEKDVKTTINIPGFHSVDVVAHEMGHTFGLRHTPGDLDAQFFPYDSRWSVMSDGYVYYEPANCFGPQNDCYAAGLIGYQVDQLEWIDPARKLVIDAATATSEVTTVTIDRLRDPLANDNLLYVEVQLTNPADEFLTLETRIMEPTTNDYGVPASGIVMHQVDVDDPGDATTIVIDATDNDNVNDDGAAWVPGEVYIDTANGIQVAVIDDPTATSYTVEIGPASLLPERLFPADEQIVDGANYEGPEFTFTHIDGVEWYQVWIGTDTDSPPVTQALYEWYPATDNSAEATTGTGICDTETNICTIPDADQLWLPDGDYSWWVSVWGPDDTSADITASWAESKFTVAFDPASTTITFTDPAAGTTVSEIPNPITWERDLSVLWYNVWIGTVPDYDQAYLNWTDATEDCTDTVCEIDTTGLSFPDGDYEIWVEVWGPDAYVTWLEIGTTATSTFTVGAPAVRPAR